MYCIADYFRGVLIFVVFVVHPDVMKNFTHEIFHTLCALSTRAQIWTGNVFLWLFFTTCIPLAVPWYMYTGSPFSSRPACEGWGSEQSSVEGRSMTNRKQGQYLLSTWKSLKSAWHHSKQISSYHSRVGIVAVLQYWPPIFLCGRGSLSHSPAHQTQPTPGQIAFSKPNLHVTNPSANGF